MKRLNYILIMILTCVLLGGCENPKKDVLRKNVKESNAECPINMGIAGDLLSVKYSEKENKVYFYFSVNEQISGSIFIKGNQEKMKQNLRLLLTSPDVRRMVNDMCAVNASLMLIYKSPSSGKVAKIDFSSDELKEIRSTPPMSEIEMTKLTLDNSIDMGNMRCPYAMEDGIMMTRLELGDDNLIYYCEVDESRFEMQAMNDNKEYLTNFIKSGFKERSKDETLRRDIRMITSLNKGIQYRYYGNKSKECFDVIFTPEELKTYL